MPPEKLTVRIDEKHHLRTSGDHWLDRMGVLCADTTEASMLMGSGTYRGAWGDAVARHVENGVASPNNLEHGHPMVRTTRQWNETMAKNSLLTVELAEPPAAQMDWVVGDGRVVLNGAVPGIQLRRWRTRVQQLFDPQFKGTTDEGGPAQGTHKRELVGFVFPDGSAVTGTEMDWRLMGNVPQLNSSQVTASCEDRETA